MSEENKIADNDVRVFAKQVRQQLKIQCLDLAMRKANPEDEASSIVIKAKAFYAFART